MFGLAKFKVMAINTKAEADQLVALLLETANDGRNLIVVTDDAYFGLFYDDEVLQESLFARLAGIHDRILAVKVDGPTKELSSGASAPAC